MEKSVEEWGNTGAPWFGEFQHGLDAKRRVALPARLRGAVTRFVAVRGTEGCVSLFTEDEWTNRLNKGESLTVSNRAEARAVRRLLISGAMCVDVDGQGRLLVPESLGRYAGIRKDVTVIGLKDRIELWSSERWLPYKARAEKIFARIAKHIDL